MWQLLISSAGLMDGAKLTNPIISEPGVFGWLHHLQAVKSRWQVNKLNKQGKKGFPSKTALPLLPRFPFVVNSHISLVNLKKHQHRPMLTTLPGQQFTAAFVYWDLVHHKNHFHAFVCWFSWSQNPPQFLSVGNWTSNCWLSKQRAKVLKQGSFIMR